MWYDKNLHCGLSLSLFLFCWPSLSSEGLLPVIVKVVLESVDVHALIHIIRQRKMPLGLVLSGMPVGGGHSPQPVNIVSTLPVMIFHVWIMSPHICVS